MKLIPFSFNQTLLWVYHKVGFDNCLELFRMEASYASSLIFFYIYAQYLIVNIWAVSANPKSSHHSQPPSPLPRPFSPSTPQLPILGPRLFALLYPVTFLTAEVSLRMSSSGRGRSREGWRRSQRRWGTRRCRIMSGTSGRGLGKSGWGWGWRRRCACDGKQLLQRESWGGRTEVSIGWVNSICRRV